MSFKSRMSQSFSSRIARMEEHAAAGVQLTGRPAPKPRETVLVSGGRRHPHIAATRHDRSAA